VGCAANISFALKLNGKKKKYILKKRCPRASYIAKKWVFQCLWLISCLTDCFDSADGIFPVEESGLSQCFNMKKARRLWHNYQQGRDENTQELWSMLAFELWWRAYHS
jgi:asparagine synthase (glutamine-hydrolysing)